MSLAAKKNNLGLTAGLIFSGVAIVTVIVFWDVISPYLLLFIKLFLPI